MFDQTKKCPGCVKRTRAKPKGFYVDDYTTELEVLGCLIENPRLVSSPGLTEDIFTSPSRQDAFNAIADLVSRGEPMDALVVLDAIKRLAGTEAYERACEELDWASITEAAAGPSTLPHRIRKLTQNHAMTRLKVLGETLLHGEPGDLDETLGMARTQLERVERQVHVYGPEPEKKHLDTFMTSLYAGTETQGLPTGFDKLDDLIGGLKPGLTVVAGMPGSGKTTFAKQVADHVAMQGTPVLFLALDESVNEQRKKTLCRLSNIPKRRLGDLENRERVQRAFEEYLTFADKLYMVGQSQQDMLKADRLWATLETMKERHGTERVLLIVDYLQRYPVEATSKSWTDKQQVDECCKVLGILSDRTGAPILAISSQNRAAYRPERGKSEQDAMPLIGDLTGFKESGMVEYQATVAMQLWRDKNGTEKLKEAMQDANSQPLQEVHRCIVHKTRDSGKGVVNLLFYPVQARFEELDEIQGMRLDKLGYL